MDYHDRKLTHVGGLIFFRIIWSSDTVKAVITIKHN